MNSFFSFLSFFSSLLLLFFRNKNKLLLFSLHLSHSLILFRHFKRSKLKPILFLNIWCCPSSLFSFSLCCGFILSFVSLLILWFAYFDFYLLCLFSCIGIKRSKFYIFTYICRLILFSHCDPWACFKNHWFLLSLSILLDSEPTRWCWLLLSLLLLFFLNLFHS